MTTDSQDKTFPEESSPVALNKGMEMMISGFIPSPRYYFDSRFDLLQVQVDLLRKGQDDIKSQVNRLEDQFERRFERSDDIIKEFKNSVDKRFERSDDIIREFKNAVDKRFEQSDQKLDDFKIQVDKRFEQMIASIDRLSEKLDQRDERSRSFTIRRLTPFFPLEQEFKTSIVRWSFFHVFLDT